jgi:1-acyl-sn-glycerol-3-phosphate acyltransferase
LENVPKVGGGLVLANHSSFLDPLLIGLPLQRPVSFLARDSLFRVPVVGWILRNTFVMPINREAASTAGVREMVSRIDAGYLVGIFPEGTRSEDGTVGAFKPGFTAVLRRTTDPVYPVGIAGADKALGRRHWVMRPSRVCVVFGEPIPRHVLEPLMQRGRETELLELMRQRVMDAQADANAWLAGESLPKKAQA